MRTTLFRGKRIDNGDWVEGTPIESNIDLDGYKTYMYIDYTIKNTIPLDTGSGYFGCCVEVTPETIGEFTGLTDKNGVKIFEGDNCRIGKSFLWDCIVYFENGRFNIAGYKSKHLEVIGNIHDKK